MSGPRTFISYSWTSKEHAIVSGRHLNYSRFLETRARDRARSALRGVEAVLKGRSRGLPDQWRRREKRGAIYKPSLVTQITRDPAYDIAQPRVGRLVVKPSQPDHGSF